MACASEPLPDRPTVAVDAESPEFLRRMAALVPGIIYVFNHKTMSNEYSNRSIAELLGYTPQELVDMGEDLIARCVHEDDLPELVRYFASIGEVPDGEYTSFKYRDYAKNGDIVWLHSIDTPFERAADGSLVRHIGIAFDITAQKKAEQELLDLNAELEFRVAERTRALAALNNELEARVEARTRQLREANKELEQLSFVATHDLKAPVDNMSGLTALLAEARESLPPEHAQTLDWMREVCAQASAKLEALVQVAQANTLPAAPFVPVGLGAALARVRAALRPEIEAAGAVLDADFACPTVCFLPGEVDNILTVLLSNALKYRDPERLPRIRLRSARLPEGVRLTVADNGSGFDAGRDYGKVFGLFQRAHVTPEGAGVSLYALRRVMEQIGGSIEAEGRPGRGSTFTLLFPEAAAAPCAVLPG